MEWKKVRLDTLCSQIRGVSYKKEEIFEEYIDGTTPLLRANNILGKGKLELEKVLYVKKNRVKDEQLILKGDIIIAASSGSIDIVGKSGQAKDNLNKTFGAFCKLIRNKNKNILSSEYLGCFFNSPYYKREIRKSAEGSNINNLRNEHIDQLEIPLPPIEVQIKIAEALDKAQELIDNRKLQLEKYDELIQSTFIDMFGDPVTNPKKWEIKEIKKLIEGKISNGFFASNYNYEDKGTQIIWISDFINKFYSNITQLKRVVISEKDLEKNLVEYGDAIFCRSSLTKEGIGKCAIIPEFLEEKIIYECHIIKIKLNMKIIIPEFFRAYSDLTYFRNQIMKYSKTSTMTTISQEGILKGLVYLPPLEKQLKFKNIVTKIFEKKRLCEESLKQMEENFNSMIDKAFKGELF